MEKSHLHKNTCIIYKEELSNVNKLLKEMFKITGETWKLWNIARILQTVFITRMRMKKIDYL